MSIIGASVGAGGKNVRRDVKAVQRLLNKHSLPPLQKLSIDGIAGQNTIDTIRHFQSVVVKMRAPDSRVDPGGKTFRHLNQGPAPAKDKSVGKKDSKKSATSSNNANLSGERWWRANQRRYPNSSNIDQLEGSFRGNVQKFVNALKNGKANVSVASTKRNNIRAHLMHYSWRIANGDILPSEVPQISGLNIQWDHGDLEESQHAARRMKELFNLAYKPSLTSNHIKGKAIDMNITWKGRLTLDVPGQEQPEIIASGARNGHQNRQLHRVGRKFGVLKLLKDKPHWSFNGG